MCFSATASFSAGSLLLGMVIACKGNNHPLRIASLATW
jgi:hypothetical protein